MQGTKKKSKRWSLADIKTIKKFVLTAKNEGMEEHVGLQAAATQFGVTLNSVTLRWRRWNKGEHSKTLKRKTTKIPMERKKREKRKYTKKQVVDAIIDDGGIAPVKRNYTKKASMVPKPLSPVTHNVYPVAREITFDIRDVKVDLVNKKITFIY